MRQPLPFSKEPLFTPDSDFLCVPELARHSLGDGGRTLRLIACTVFTGNGPVLLRSVFYILRSEYKNRPFRALILEF